MLRSLWERTEEEERCVTERMLSDALLKDIVEWDVYTWRKAVIFWDAYIDAHLIPDRMRVLEIGARGGGVSMFFAQKGFSVTCSDRGETFEQARALHAGHGVAEAMTYVDADCTCLPFGDESFDAVVFKSVLGSVGRDGHDERMEVALSELRRVLRPGGVLFFAENLSATRVHRAFRRRFSRWGTQWNYLSLPRVKALLQGFSQVEMHTYGLFGCFMKDHPLTKWLDETCCKKEPSEAHYMCYGAAVK